MTAKLGSAESNVARKCTQFKQRVLPRLHVRLQSSGTLLSGNHSLLKGRNGCILLASRDFQLLLQETTQLLLLDQTLVQRSDISKFLLQTCMAKQKQQSSSAKPTHALGHAKVPTTHCNTSATPHTTHHCLTPVHTSKRLPQWLCPMQPRYIGHTASLTALAEGDRSLMWPYHITGTPGCSTPLCSVPLHCTQGM